MRILLTAISALIISSAAAQNIPEKEISSEINEVTVFIEGAQITRITDVDLAQGKTTLKFSNLSPYIDSKTIQVKVNNEVAILAVNFQQNFLNKLQKSDELKQLETKLQSLNQKITTTETNIEITSEEIRFLQKNSVITGANQSTNLSSFKEILEYYGSKMKQLKMHELELNKTLTDLEQQRDELIKQIRSTTLDKEPTSGEIMISIDATKALKAKFELQYLVNNASWFPCYDIRANSIDKPLEVMYKANVRQNTKVDWKNVKLKFSSSKPSTTGVAPKLLTYQLGYNVMAPRYSNRQTSVSGCIVSAEDNLPLPGASVTVPNTTITTFADINGNYSITLPANAQQLTFAYIGFQSQTINIYGANINIALQPTHQELEDVVVVAYGSSKKRSRHSLMMNSAAAEMEETIVEDNEETGAISVNSDVPMQAENQTSVSFEINKPYSIASGNKTTAVDMIQYNIAAKYQYYSVPKIDMSAYLIANITEWEKFRLLEGEANVFFEGTFMGKTLLDTRSAGDTLQISLGQDKSISISREKVKNYTNKQIIGTKKEESRCWKTIVKNNKQQKIELQIFDQVPISTNQEIEVIVGKTSGATLNSENGEIKWEFSLNPSEKKELELNYSVKYPKNKKLVVE